MGRIYRNSVQVVKSEVRVFSLVQPASTYCSQGMDVGLLFPGRVARGPRSSRGKVYYFDGVGCRGVMSSFISSWMASRLLTAAAPSVFPTVFRSPAPAFGSTFRCSTPSVATNARAFPPRSPGAVFLTTLSMVRGGFPSSPRSQELIYFSCLGQAIQFSV